MVQSLLALLVEKMKSDDWAACESPCLKLAKYVSVQTECDWSPVCTSWQWMEWSKLALKYGEDPELESAFLLAALSTSCAAIMKHNKQMVASLCEMVFSHSKFLRVILGHTKHKDELVGLLLTLLQIDSSTVVQDHIPIFLAAYGLTLSVLDQQIVKLFQICESNGIRFQKWKPYIWGEAAISHYSVYSVLQPTSLGNASSLLQCLEHLQQETVNNTITHFPCERSYTKTVAEDASVYDPAFYIPLFVSLLAPGELVRSYKFAQSGALALTVRALSLEDNKLRQAAYLVLSRYHNHLCIRPNKDQEIWLQFLNALRGGVMKLVQQEQKGNKHVVLPRLSSVVTVFFARACQILANPTMLMYPVITNYLLTKKYFNLTAVPEFLSLIHSNDVKQELHRNWILEVLRDGIHDADDLRLCLNSVALKFVMDLYSTITPPRISNIHLSHTEDQTATMKNSRTQILILEVIVSCTKSPENSKLLLDKYGLLAWLGGVIQCYKLTDALIPPIISILSSLIRYKAYTQYITELLFTLIREHRPSADQISHIVRVLDQYRTIVPFTEANVKELMEAVSSILDRQQLQNMQRCRNILIYGSAYQMCIEEPVEIISQLRDIVLVFASKHLRK